MRLELAECSGKNRPRLLRGDWGEAFKGPYICMSHMICFHMMIELVLDGARSGRGCVSVIQHFRSPAVDFYRAFVNSFEGVNKDSTVLYSLSCLSGIPFKEIQHIRPVLSVNV